MRTEPDRPEFRNMTPLNTVSCHRPVTDTDARLTDGYTDPLYCTLTHTHTQTLSYGKQPGELVYILYADMSGP